jgi:hypothetical protein
MPSIYSLVIISRAAPIGSPKGLPPHVILILCIALPLVFALALVMGVVHCYLKRYPRELEPARGGADPEATAHQPLPAPRPLPVHSPPVIDPYAAATLPSRNLSVQAYGHARSKSLPNVKFPRPQNVGYRQPLPQPLRHGPVDLYTHPEAMPTYVPLKPTYVPPMRKDKDYD